MGMTGHSQIPNSIPALVSNQLWDEALDSNVGWR